MELYLYIIAAAIAVGGVLFFFKTNIEKIKENPENAAVAQRNFFIGVALSEAIPIVLLIYAFLNVEAVADLNDILVPAIFILLLMGVATFFIFLQRAVGVPEKSRNAVNQLSIIAISMANAVPIIALVFLYISVG